MLEAAPAETMRHATAQAFAALDPADRRQIRERFHPLPTQGDDVMLALAAPEPAELAQLAAEAEEREPGSVEILLRGLQQRAANPPASIWAKFAEVFSETEEAREFFAARA